jgi:hypothetical protein
MGWFAVQLSEQECFQVLLESKETLAGTKFSDNPLARVILLQFNKNDTLVLKSQPQAPPLLLATIDPYPFCG